MQTKPKENLLLFVNQISPSDSLAFEYTTEDLEKKTIGNVLSELSSDKIYRVTDFYGNSISRDKAIGYYLELQPFYILSEVPKADPEEEVIVNISDNSSPNEMSVKLGNTVAELKGLIDENLGIPTDDCCLRFGEFDLEESDTLLEYGITSGSTIEIVNDHRGGGKEGFRAIDMDQGAKAQTIKIDNSGPKWRIVKPGLNLEGVCKGSSCTAKGTIVIINKDFGVYDFEADAKSNKCPNCKTDVEIQNVGFYKCLYTYVGKRKEGGSARGGKFERIEGDNYILFDQKKTGDAKWESLKVVTGSLDKLQKANQPIKKDTKGCGHCQFDERFKIINLQSKEIQIPCVECFLDIKE